MVNNLSALLAHTMSLSDSSVAQERGSRYGAFGFASSTIAVLVTIFVALVVASVILATVTDLVFTACFVVIATIVIEMMLLVTWWTSFSWSSKGDGGTGVVVGSIIAIVATGIGVCYFIEEVRDK
ncbi:MAG: hypothetical protein ABIQ04_01690 [Candidatus Saccharimonadales bacterium]